MSRPTSLLLAGQTFRVRWLPEDQPMRRDGHVGETVPEKQTIAISEGQGFECERDTVIHEVLHAIVTLTGNGDRFSDDDAKEAVVTCLSVGLLAALRHNHGLAEYLTERSVASAGPDLGADYVEMQRLHIALGDKMGAWRQWLAENYRLELEPWSVGSLTPFERGHVDGWNAAIRSAERALGATPDPRPETDPS